MITLDTIYGITGLSVAFVLSVSVETIILVLLSIKIDQKKS
jgi:hypothetical protein